MGDHLGGSCTQGPGSERLLHAAPPPEKGTVLAGVPGPFPARPHSGTAQKPSLLTLPLCPSLEGRV